MKDKICVVTGAASGYGAGISRAFVAEGASVVLLDINFSRAERLANELGACAAPFHADVTSSKDLTDAIRFCKSKFGIPNVIVNNAGTTHKNMPLMDVSEADFDRVFAVNVKSIFYMTKAVVPELRNNGGGVILNIGSTAGIRPRPGLTWYNGSKGAVNLLSKSLAVELAPEGIRVNAICPVIGETALLEDFMGMPDTPENREKFLATIPLGRFAKPSDVASAAVYLASDSAEFINGVELPVDGGRVI